ncbi:isoquinoline 1-oxidoreductase [Bradyrhizobium canariense]|uniref:Isoquinoline 1-oxidoreductase n=1 Tax=Bradyrhizobium canariense TaxID=255045 RepID=A0ABX3WXD8_9BRAD|nr:molybdopterin cofactor-binding domain-containing protein [Bradyrhizobium canariense]OSJ08884.1 isoquinoline 1-oxidoreductase [Bradyrhizobium canariense]OSJ24278.1 isoquinoline 1-oxidoreductase [Bradyrhizobium canariense]
MIVPFTPSRRDLLLGGGSLVVALSLAGSRAAPTADALSAAQDIALDQVDSYLAVDKRGLVTVYAGKVELGTGVRTGFTQIVADELDVAMVDVNVIQGDTALTPDQGATYGSQSIQIAGLQLRQAAATARSALLSEAAKRLGAPKEELIVLNGAIRARSGGNTLTYAELIGGKSFILKVDPAVLTKSPADYRFVGQPMPRLDIPGKVTGQFTYMHDFRVAGMLHGRVVRPPAIGASLESVDVSSIADIAGIVKVVREGNFLGVVAQTEWSAVRAAREIKTRWSNSESLPDEQKLWDYVRTTSIVKDDVTSDIGDAPAAMAGEGRTLRATYDFAIHTHGSIGPSCAISEFRDGKLISWSASQATHNLRKQLALMFSMRIDDVRCIFIDGSGCYGRNGHEDAAADSALLAKAVGKPVRVQWSRADEHGWDPKGPPTLIDLRANLDAAGTVTAWESEFFIPQGAAGNVELLAATLAEKPFDAPLAPGGITGDSAIGYTFPNIKTVCHRLETTPLRPSWIRTPGRMQNTFANECFLDEIAAAANSDPLDFRIKYTDPADRRGLEVLMRLGRLAKWQRGPSSRRDAGGALAWGRGVSYVKYELVRTYIGAVAEVEVNRSSGDIHVTRFYIVHDCGQIINPNGVRSQIEGSVIQTVSRTLKEEVTYNRSMVTSLDWATYPILTFSEVPELVIEMIDRPSERPWGAGEPTAAIVPSSISNAVFNAVGVRLRSVPFKPEKVRAALRAN